MCLKTGTGVERKRDIHDPAVFGETDKRLGQTALQDKDFCFMAAKSCCKSYAPGGMPEGLFMGVME